MKIHKVSFEETLQTLFKAERIRFQIPKLISTRMEDAFDEIELLGFPLCNPFELLVAPSESNVQARVLPNYVGKIITIEGYLVTVKNTTTTSKKRMYFGTFIDSNGDFIDTVHFPIVANKYRFRGKGIYTITGRVIEEFDCISIEVIKMERLAIIEDPRYSNTMLEINSTKNYNRRLRPTNKQ